MVESAEKQGSLLTKLRRMGSFRLGQNYLSSCVLLDFLHYSHTADTEASISQVIETTHSLCRRHFHRPRPAPARLRRNPVSRESSALVRCQHALDYSSNYALTRHCRFCWYRRTSCLPPRRHDSQAIDVQPGQDLRSRSAQRGHFPQTRRRTFRETILHPLSRSRIRSSI